MINIKREKGGFSSIYKVKTHNYEKIVKVYKKKHLIDFNRNNLDNCKLLYESLNKVNVSPIHKILSKYILEIDEIQKDYILNKSKFFKNEELLKQFKKKIIIIQNLNNNLINIHLINEIEDYVRLFKTDKIIKNNLKKLEKYINIYPQNKICHGDIHFDNLIISKKKLYLIDWDYSVRSCLGYELAMFIHLERLNDGQINKLSKVFNISKKEIEHYLPICKLLEYFFQNIMYKLNFIKEIDKELIKNIKVFISSIL